MTGTTHTQPTGPTTGPTTGKNTKTLSRRALVWAAPVIAATIAVPTATASAATIKFTNNPYTTRVDC
ncbi:MULTISPECIES: hypothetical protein [Bacteria]|uniref:hypothetical protein n=1 Tax=Bacteria TaxID=2 RepID=UPI003C7B5947